MKIVTAFAVGLALAGALSAAPAQAQNQHSFVSSQGNDANNCSLAAPCRHLQAALLATTAGGEIAILDTAGYNGGTTVTITQAVSIVNPGGFEAEIAPPSGGTGIVINAGPTDAVSLRGLSIDGAGIGTTGIQFTSGKSLTIANCIARHVTGTGIDVAPTAATIFYISDVVASDNGANGIAIEPQGTGTAEGFIEHTAAVNNNNGILVLGDHTTGATLNVTISNSVASGNNSPGILSISTGGAATAVMAINTKANNNGYGFYTGGAGVMSLAQSSAASNTNYGVYRSAGSMFSYGDNYFNGNGNGNLIWNGLSSTLSKQ